jgi:pyruvate-ferredoxin/flavodoxin oxidoreductase
MRLAVDSLAHQARSLLTALAGRIGDGLVSALLAADQGTEAGLAAQRERVAALREALREAPGADAARLRLLADYLVKKNVWIVGGDGWAYDIGFGGLDHVLATHRDVNVLILDTEVYSNTGGQQSKATPLGAAAKFSAAGKAIPKKDLGMMAMAYGHVYVANVAFGARDLHTVRAFLEAESYPGPSLIIAYSHCIAHGYDMAFGAEQQKKAVDSGVWPLYRFDPRRVEAGEPRLVIDSPPPKIAPREYMRHETRFRMVERRDPERFRRLLAMAEKYATQRLAIYRQLAGITVPLIPDGDAAPPAAQD